MRPGAAQKITLHLDWRQSAQIFMAINPRFRFLQHLGVNIAGPDLATARTFPERITERNGDGVRFFAGRGGGAPHAIVPGTRARMLRENRKVVRLAKKGGQVGGQRIDKRLPLGAVRVAFQQRQVVAEIMNAQQTQTAHQPVVHHLALMRRQHDPGTLIDKLADAAKMRVGERQTLSHLRQRRG